MIKYGIIVHGGAGSPVEYTDGCERACVLAFAMLEGGRSSLDAVVETIRILEDDGRYNAGIGSSLRLDGKTVEMDAALMNSEGKIGIIIGIKRIRNPILAARAVLKTPHVALAGEGATIFARKQGLRVFSKPSKYALERYKSVKQIIKGNGTNKEISKWKKYNIESLWNFKKGTYRDLYCDTVGAVAIDKRGVFAVATSTGGYSPMMQGRVGDSSMLGCGFYTGPIAAVACTGIGEEIIKNMIAKRVYDMISQGKNVKEACEECIKMFPEEIKIGIIAISNDSYVVASNTKMAHYISIKEDI